MKTFVFPCFDGQRGLATTRQLLKAGATASALRNLARTGHRVFRTVYSKEVGPIPAEDLLVAASLWAGPRSVLTGWHALALHGLNLKGDPPIGVFLVPATCRARARAAGFVTLRTQRLPTGMTRNDVRIALLERALVDADRLRHLSDRFLKGLTISILQQRRSTPDRLSRELELARRNATGGILEGVLAFRQGAWSVPEAILADGVRQHPALPQMLANQALRTPSGQLIGIPDGFFPDAGVVVQVHSQEYHRGTDEEGRDLWQLSLERDMEYRGHGLVVVPISPNTLLEALPAFLEHLVGTVTPRLGWTSEAIVWE